MKVRNITNSDCINSTRLLVGFSPNSESISNIINGIVKSHKITDEFIKEFKSYITKDAFSRSPFLDVSIVEKYPDLFSLDDYIDNLFTGYTRASIDMLILHIDQILGKDNAGTVVLRAIDSATQEEIESTDVSQLISNFGDDVDKALLRKVKNEEVKEVLMLAIQLKGSETASSSALKYLSNSDKETLIGNSEVEPKAFIKTLSESNDFGWIIKMLNKAESGEIQLTKTRETFDTELVKFIANVPEEIVFKIIKLREFMPNAVSYKVLLWTLNNKDFSEDSLIDLKDIFKAAGLYFELKKFAKLKEYNRLLENL